MSRGHFSRREILGMLSSSTALLALSPSLVLASDHKDDRTQVSEQLKLKLSQALLAWQQNGLGEPEDYLGPTSLSKDQASKIKRQEFKDGKVLLVDGLILSYSEVAALAVLARSYYLA